MKKLLILFFTLMTQAALYGQSTINASVEPLFVPAQPGETGVPPERLDLVRQQVQEWVDTQHIVGAVLVVIHKDKILLNEAFGLANMAKKEPMTTDRIFLTASMTKPFTGTLVMQLVEQGKISLDDKVSQFVPELDTPETRNITVYQLLTHTGGLKAWTTGLKHDGTHSGLVRAIVKDGLSHEPGSKYLYSDRGSSVLGLLVKKVTGKPLHEMIQENILTPLGMKDSYLIADKNDPRLDRVLPRYRGEPGELRYWGGSKGVGLKFIGGSGGLYATPLDYARFLKTFQNGGKLGEVRLLNEETVALATQKHLNRNYGLHWSVGYTGIDGDGIGHGGSRGTFAWLNRDHDYIVLYFTQTRRTPTRRKLIPLVHHAITGEKTY